jgi:hypothetical protein
VCDGILKIGIIKVELVYWIVYWESMKSYASILILLIYPVLVLGGSGDWKTGFPLVYEQDFEDPSSLDDFVFADPGPWFLTGGNGGGKGLEWAGKGEYQPPYRSPFGIAVLSTLSAGDFVFEADVLQTGREYGHRDVCIFFSFQDSSSFYYTHIASRADNAAHQIHIVNNAPRTPVTGTRTDGVRWIDGHWHRIRVERFSGTGEIKVYFDDMDTPIMVATDKTFIEGYFGFGTFDDSGKIDNIRIWSPDAEAAIAEFFSRKNHQY